MQYTGSSGARNQNNMSFTTTDRDNDMDTGNCAHNWGGGGWWYRACFWTLLNSDNPSYFYWNTLGGGDPTMFLSVSRMMIKLV